MLASLKYPALLALLLSPAMAEEESKLPEVEFVGSFEFRAGSYIQPIWKGLKLESHYYGVSRADVGHVGGSWEFKIGEHFMIAPGLGVGFGSPFRTSPTATVRVAYEKEWFVGEYNLITSLRPAQFEDELEDNVKEEGGRVIHYSHLSDGNHLSYRWKRLEAGFSWEHISVREESEWKYGTRVAARLGKHLSLVTYVLFPEAEFRAGLRFTPGKE